MSLVNNHPGIRVRVISHEPAPEIRGVLESERRDAYQVGSTGIAGIEPLVTVTSDGRTGFFSDCSVDAAEGIADRLDDGAETALEEATAVVDHDPSMTDLPVPDLSGLSVGDRRVLGPCGWLRPTDPDDYRAAVGFDLPEQSTIETVGATLRGRGWGDWCQDTPVDAAWETARDAEGRPVVVVNAHGNPGDELLLSSAPFAVLEGAGAVATAVDAGRIVVYLAESAETATRRAHEAAERHPDPPATIDVVTGPDVYRAAEPTMAIEAIEGNHRLEARLRPPGPDAVGIHGDPTVVHTARTVAHLADALAADREPTTRIVTVDGDVASPATVELPGSAALEDALSAVDVDGELKAACVGGQFGGLTGSLDVAPAPDALVDAGLGTEGVVDVLGADRCLVEFVGERAQFAADTNCGRCVPCREGTEQLAEKLRALYDGTFDAAGIEELIGVMERSSICTFGVDAGRPARTAMTAFESEFQAHAHGHCPAGSCPQLAPTPR